jgi:hypothetical protein
MTNEMGSARSTYGKRRNACTVWWEDLKKRYNLKDLGIDGRIIIKLIFKWDRAWAVSIWLRTGTSGGIL